MYSQYNKSNLVFLLLEGFPSRGGLGICLDHFLDASLEKCSGYVPPGGAPLEDLQYVAWLACEGLGVTPDELYDVTGTRDVLVSLLRPESRTVRTRLQSGKG